MLFINKCIDMYKYITQQHPFFNLKANGEDHFDRKVISKVSAGPFLC